MFRWMEKYRVPILLLMVFLMIGFGIWYTIISFFRGGPSTYDPDEVVANFSIAGEVYDVTRDEFGRNRFRDNSDDEEGSAAQALSRIIRARLADQLDIRISEAEFNAAFDKQVRQPIKDQNDGVFDEKSYVRYCNQRLRMTPEDFESQFRADLRIAKLMRELDRVGRGHTSAQILEQYQKEYQTVKLEAAVIGLGAYAETTRLERDADGNLVTDSLKRLEDHWRELPDDEKKRFHTGGALLTTEFIGIDFTKYDDEKLAEFFARTNPVSGTSLEQLTEEFTPTDDDVAKLKLRLGRARESYGVGPEDDIEAAYEKKKNRLVQEWKIVRLLKKIHDDLKAQELAGTDIDLQEVAKANNLIHFRWTNRAVQDMVKDEEFPGRHPYMLQSSKEGEIFTSNPGIGVQASAFSRGPVDEPGKHASIWRLIKKDLNPTPSLTDVLEEVAKGFESKQAETLRDADFAAFQKLMNDFMDEQIKTYAAEVEAETAAAIKTATEGLDPEREADKARIDEVTAEKNAERDAKLAEAKKPHRRAAFEHAIANAPGKVTVVREGFFVPSKAAREQPADREKASYEEKARSFVRREFRALHDKVGAMAGGAEPTVIEVGTVSDVQNSSLYQGMKGIAMVVEKKVPTARDMFLHPDDMAGAQRSLMSADLQKMREGSEATMWSYAELKRAETFGLKADRLDQEIEERRTKERDTDAELKAYKARRKADKDAREKQEREANEAQMKAMQERALKAAEDAKKATEDANKAAEGGATKPDGN